MYVESRKLFTLFECLDIEFINLIPSLIYKEKCPYIKM